MVSGGRWEAPMGPRMTQKNTVGVTRRQQQRQPRQPALSMAWGGAWRAGRASRGALAHAHVATHRRSGRTSSPVNMTAPSSRPKRTVRPAERRAAVGDAPAVAPAPRAQPWAVCSAAPLVLETRNGFTGDTAAERASSASGDGRSGAIVEVPAEVAVGGATMAGSAAWPAGISSCGSRAGSGRGAGSIARGWWCAGQKRAFEFELELSDGGRAQPASASTEPEGGRRERRAVIAARSWAVAAATELGGTATAPPLINFGEFVFGCAMPSKSPRLRRGTAGGATGTAGGRGAKRMNGGGRAHEGDSAGPTSRRCVPPPRAPEPPLAAHPAVRHSTPRHSNRAAPRLPPAPPMLSSYPRRPPRRRRSRPRRRPPDRSPRPPRYAPPPRAAQQRPAPEPFGGGRRTN